MHTDPELLSLLALGEDAGTEADRTHTQTCPRCAQELSELVALVALGRRVGAETRLVAPGEDVWVRIRDELALGRPRRSQPWPINGAATGMSDGSSSELAARATLAPVDAGWSHASGQAELATDEQGRRLLRVALHADLSGSGLRQAWLVHRDNPNVRQSLGVLDGPHGLWTVARNIDLEQYGILDISEQRIGQTDHSGQTIVRGELRAVA